MRVDELIDRALLAMGENPAMCPEETGGVIPEQTLRAKLRLRVEDKAREAVLTTSPESLEGWRAMPGAGLTVNQDGSAMLPLPSDFLLLHSLRLKSWARPVTRLLSREHWLRRLQGGSWHGLRGCPERPLAFLAVTASGRAAEMFGALPGDTLAEGWYYPRPAIDASGEISLPGVLASRCVELLSESGAQ